MHGIAALKRAKDKGIVDNDLEQEQEEFREEVLLPVLKVTIKLRTVDRFDKVNEEIQNFLEQLKLNKLLVDVEYLYLKKTKDYVNISEFVKEADA